MFGSGFHAGRLFGINIRIDWSWLFIFVLVTWNLMNAFAQLHPSWVPNLRLILALAAAILFFLSVLAHEIAHSLVARSFGLPVKNVVLFLFGGVANIQREPPSPRAEFLIAAAGPFTNLVLGGLLLLVARPGLLQAAADPLATGSALARLSPATTILLWLGSVNVVLAAFNLIPGFPLDGGRVLRSILWGVTRSLNRATRMAATVGQGIAWSMIAAGIGMALGLSLPLLGTGLANGLWMVFIGWFINSASVQSNQQLAVKEMMEGIPVRRLMRADPPTLEPDCTVNDLMHVHLMNSDDLAFPVIEQEQLVGIVSLDDVRHAPRDQWDATQVGQIMTPRDRLVTTTPDEELSAAMEKLIQRDVRQLPVVDAGSRLIGLLRRRDVMRWMQSRSQMAR